MSIDMTSIKGILLSDVTLEMISLYSIKKKITIFAAGLSSQ